jgi:hypothetical protein
MVPYNVLLQLAIVPLREPNRDEMRARFSDATTPGDLQRRLAETVSVPLRYPPEIVLEAIRERSDGAARAA